MPPKLDPSLDDFNVLRLYIMLDALRDLYLLELDHWKHTSWISKGKQQLQTSCIPVPSINLQRSPLFCWNLKLVFPLAQSNGASRSLLPSNLLVP